jgi:hypothetical protein
MLNAPRRAQISVLGALGFDLAHVMVGSLV